MARPAMPCLSALRMPRFLTWHRMIASSLRMTPADLKDLFSSRQSLVGICKSIGRKVMSLSQEELWIHVAACRITMLECGWRRLFDHLIGCQDFPSFNCDKTKHLRRISPRFWRRLGTGDSLFARNRSEERQ